MRKSLSILAVLAILVFGFTLPASAAEDSCAPEAGTTFESFPKASKRSARLPASDDVTTTVSPAVATVGETGVTYSWTVTTVIVDNDPYFYRTQRGVDPEVTTYVDNGSCFVAFDPPPPDDDEDPRESYRRALYEYLEQRLADRLERIRSRVDRP